MRQLNKFKDIEWGVWLDFTFWLIVLHLVGLSDWVETHIQVPILDSVVTIVVAMILMVTENKVIDYVHKKWTERKTNKSRTKTL